MSGLVPQRRREENPLVIRGKTIATAASEKSLGKSLSHGESSAVVRRRSMPRGSLNQQRHAGAPC